MRLLLPALASLFMISCGNQSGSNTTATDSSSWNMVPFIKSGENPVMAADSIQEFYCPVRKEKVKWEQKDVFNPAAIVRNDTLFLLYRAEDMIGKFAGTSRIGLAWSLDGIHFTRHPSPVLYPDNDSLKVYEWEGGCEDPRIVEDDKGTYYLTYTAYDGDKARLMVATSNDLYHWSKKGHAFKQSGNPSFVHGWSKSGSIISRYNNGKIVAERVKGKYWMYWGDTQIFMATSDDLVNWQPLTDSAGNLQVAFGPRPGRFDSDLVEPGPAAMITPAGILMIYNCRNVKAKGDTSLAEGTYAPSQILFDAADPGRVINRMETYFMKPEQPYEVNGQVNHVCFAEGLVQYKNKWFLYYGTADSKIAVALH